MIRRTKLAREIIVAASGPIAKILFEEVRIGDSVQPKHGGGLQRSPARAGKLRGTFRQLFAQQIERGNVTDVG